MRTLAPSANVENDPALFGEWAAIAAILSGTIEGETGAVALRAVAGAENHSIERGRDAHSLDFLTGAIDAASSLVEPYKRAGAFLDRLEQGDVV